MTITIGIIAAAAALLSLSMITDVNTTGFSECLEEYPASSNCEARAEHPETYCLQVEEDPFCDDVDLCDDEGDITSDHDYCMGDAVRNPSGQECPEGTHNLEDDERGLCYFNNIPCPEGTIKTLKEGANYEGAYYCAGNW